MKKKKINKKKKNIKKAKKAVKKTKKNIKKPKKVIRKTVKKDGTKKLSSLEKKTEILNHLADGLIEKGRKRGFITYDEILKTFPDIENNILFLDELYEKFGVASIDVLEGGNLLNLDLDLNDKDLNKGSMHDSIRLFTRATKRCLPSVLNTEIWKRKICSLAPTCVWWFLSRKNTSVGLPI